MAAPLATISGGATGLSTPGVSPSISSTTNWSWRTTELAHRVLRTASATRCRCERSPARSPVSTMVLWESRSTRPTTNISSRIRSSGLRFSLPSGLFPTADGNVAPLRVIAGAATGLANPTGSRSMRERRAARPETRPTTHHRPCPHGERDSAPLRTLAGAATLLNNPQFLALTTGGILPATATPTATATPP